MNCDATFTNLINTKSSDYRHELSDSNKFSIVIFNFCEMKVEKWLSFAWLPTWKSRTEEIPERFQKQAIHDTDLTVAWLIESLRKSDKVFAAKYGNRVPKTVSCHDVSDGKGLFSVVLKVKLEFENSVYFTIVKIPGTYVFDKMIAEGKGGNFEFVSRLFVLLLLSTWIDFPEPGNDRQRDDSNA